MKIAATKRASVSSRRGHLGSLAGFRHSFGPQQKASNREAGLDRFETYSKLLWRHFEKTVHLLLFDMALTMKWQFVSIVFATVQNSGSESQRPTPS
jgi:hypothetical protein